MVRVFYCLAGTPVWTAEGMQAIETIEKGQRVYAFDPHELKVDTKAVMQTFIRQTDTLIYLTVKGQQIVTTPLPRVKEPIRWFECPHSDLSHAVQRPKGYRQNENPDL